MDEIILKMEDINSKEVEWIIENREFLCIANIEKHLKMPASTLSKVVNGKRRLPEKWDLELRGFVNFGLIRSLK